jgi:hypothetical protein
MARTCASSTLGTCVMRPPRSLRFTDRQIVVYAAVAVVVMPRWPKGVKGDWLCIVDYEVPYADGRAQVDGRARKVRLVDQLVPGYALRHRETADSQGVADRGEGSPDA